MNRRSIYGLVLMLGIVPIISGLLACMPVAIGNPERSKVDPDINGIWAALTIEDESDEGPGAYIFEPFDKRTWLIAGVGLKAGENADLGKYDLSSYEGYKNLAANEVVDAEHAQSSRVSLYKAWLTKLGGEWFFTWEPKNMSDGIAEDPEYWMVFHVTRADGNTMVLRMVNGESEPFDDIDKTRRAYEKVIKKHVDDPEIYGGDDEYRITLHRAEGDVLSFLEDVADAVIADE